MLAIQIKFRTVLFLCNCTVQRQGRHILKAVSIRPQPVKIFPRSFAAITSTVMAQESTVLSSSDDGPIFFWREFEEPYGFLSQWYECIFEHDGIKYQHAEMWMMTQKARLFGDKVLANKCSSSIKSLTTMNLQARDAK